jgi:hypothetical protein
MAMSEDYTKTYTTFSGCDIVPTFNGKVIGELQGITYSISREKAPIYTMGSAEPRSFSRGKRGIAGTLIFTVFNRDALISEFKDSLSGKEGAGIQKFVANNRSSAYISIEDWDSQMSELANPGGNTVAGAYGDVNKLVDTYEPEYADEILPFDITITFANEYKQRAVLVIYGVELLNEGSGYSIDSVTTEKAYTFIARKIQHMKPVTDDSAEPFHSTF